MSLAQPPSVEVIQAPHYATPTAQSNKRLGSFLLTFLVLTAIGLAFVYGRAPVYRATASVLTVKPKAVDRASAGADLEHVAIQGRALLGEALLSQLARRLVDDDLEEPASVAYLLKTLDIVEIPATNLLELRATGHDPETLQLLVNRWAERYEIFRRGEIEAATALTSAELLDEQIELDRKIEAKREQLRVFRVEHDIVSLERGENSSLAGLQGLNASLNQARDRLIQARARKSAIEQSEASGITVVPASQKAEIARLKLELSRTKMRLEGLREKYTERYIERDPTLQKLPQSLIELEADLKNALVLAAQTAREEADHDLATAHAIVVRLEEKLAQHQQGVQTFTGHFKSFKVLEESLKGLEKLRADNDQRLAKIQITNQEKFPAIKVVDWARLPVHALYPDYDRDLGIALVAALILALFLTWLREYLTNSPNSSAPQAPYVGVRVFADRANTALQHPSQNAIEQNPATSATLSHVVSAAGSANTSIALPRELAQVEIKALASALEPLENADFGLLLSGIAPGELTDLSIESFAAQTMCVALSSGPNARDIAIDATVWPGFGPILDYLKNGMKLHADALDLRLIGAARENALSDPTTVTALALWHSYVVFLVRQGIARDDLEVRVGRIDPALFDALYEFAPAGGARAGSAINYIYPTLV